MLLHSYNGAWWYLHSYVILMFIPPVVTLAPVRKLPVWLGLAGCLCLDLGLYLIGRFDLWPAVPDNEAAAFVYTEAKNLIGIMPYIWAGAFLCKGKVMRRGGEWLDRHIPARYQTAALLGLWALIFVGTNLLQKAAVIGVVAVLVFLMFNLVHKAEPVRRVFLFLGKHSTNIWLTHMFFYNYIFKGLVQSVRYPLFMLAFLLLLCIGTSYVVIGIQKTVGKLTNGT